MKMTFKSVLPFLITTPLFALPCKNPFANQNTSFLLQETLDCSKALSSPELRLVNSSNPNFQKMSDFFTFKSSCVQGSKTVDLLYNTSSNFTIIDWSQNTDSSGQIFKIKLTCKEGTIAILDTRRQSLSLNGNNPSVSYTVFDSVNTETIIAYVLESEDNTNTITVRSSNGAIIATAKKNFVSGSICYANWAVQNQGMDPTVLSYILTWKDSMNLNCQLPSGNSALSTYAAVMGTLGLVAVPVGAFVWWYWKYARAGWDRIEG